MVLAHAKDSRVENRRIGAIRNRHFDLCPQPTLDRYLSLSKPFGASSSTGKASPRYSHRSWQRALHQSPDALAFVRPRAQALSGQRHKYRLTFKCDTCTERSTHTRRSQASQFCHPRREAQRRREPHHKFKDWREKPGGRGESDEGCRPTWIASDWF